MIDTTGRNRRRPTEPARCHYCFAPFLRFADWGAGGHSKVTCSPECAARNVAWNRWLRETAYAGILGDVSKAPDFGPGRPAGGNTLAASVARFELSEMAA